MKTQSDELSARILAILVEKKLFMAEDAAKFVEKLALGKMRAEDWRVAIEKAADKEKAT